MSAPEIFNDATGLRFQIGARTLLSWPMRLRRVAWSLDDVLAQRDRPLPPLGGAEGYLLTSVPETLLGRIGMAGFACHVRQRYERYHVDLTVGHAAWAAGLSANTRQTLRRKAKKLAGVDPLDVRAYRTPDEIATFLKRARRLSATTYQERLLDAGLPDTETFHVLAAALAAADAVRAWLLHHEGLPIAYLWCAAEGDTLRYDHVGHDPAFGHLSPGAVLHAEALRRLFEDRFGLFDFTEGEGQHKRQLASGGTACADVVLLRPTLDNRAVLAALTGFDATVAFGKKLARKGVAKRAGDWLRRA